MATILIAEDDANIRLGLTATLESEGHRVLEACNGEEALKAFHADAVDLVLLDVMMPELSGYEVCKRIRATNQTTPVLMLTAKGEELDKVVGLKLGADDYITKPFGIAELLARIASALRRAALCQPSAPEIEENDTFQIGPWRVEPQSQRAYQGEQRIDLSKRETALLQCFAEHRGKVLSRDFLLDRVWGLTYTGTTRTLDQHMVQLRKKIEADPGSPQWIKTVHGSGYRYE